MLVLYNLQPLHCSTCILNASPCGILCFVYIYIFNIVNNYCLLVLIHAGKHCEPENLEIDCHSGDNGLAEIVICCSKVVVCCSAK